jgi:hypothetical protein
MCIIVCGLIRKRIPPSWHHIISNVDKGYTYTAVLRAALQARVSTAGPAKDCTGKAPRQLLYSLLIMLYSPLLELAASPYVGNGASPLSDGRAPLIGGEEAPEEKQRG